MQTLARIPCFLLDRRLHTLCLLAIPALLLGPARLPAQQKEDLAAPACTPSNLSALIVPEGRSVHVSPVEEPSFHGPSNLGNPSAANSAPTPKALRAQAEAYKLLEKEARRGSVAAQVNLAVASLARWGVPSNADTALFWLHTAAGEGYTPALFDLGILYSKGCGVRQDYTEAFRFFQTAAISGDLAAAVNLGYLYDRGLGVTQDQSAAARWYRQSADHGEPRAQYNLADLFLRGAGVPLDESLAFSWFQRAALQGHSGARIMLGSMLASGRGTKRDLQSAYVWLLAASLQGDPRGDATLQSVEHQLTAAQIAAARNQARSLPRTASQLPDLARLH